MHTHDSLSEKRLPSAASEHPRVRPPAPTVDGCFAAICDPSRRPVTLAIVSLLDFARQALTRDVQLAGRYIADATDLLRAESALEGHGAPGRLRGSLAPWQIRAVTTLIENKMPYTIRMDDLAGAARLSTSYFSGAFHRTVGESPFAYVRRCRIARAQQMMLLTDRSLADIALECGLADQSHLTRCFRTLVGDSPGAWRRLRRTSGRVGSVSATLNIGIEQGCNS
jgi:AraC family transcriptional regulator